MNFRTQKDNIYNVSAMYQAFFICRQLFLIKMIFLLILLLATFQEVKNHEINPSKTIIWGPGLKPDKITMRARYIFLQFVDLQSKKYDFYFDYIYIDIYILKVIYIYIYI